MSLPSKKRQLKWPKIYIMCFGSLLKTRCWKRSFYKVFNHANEPPKQLFLFNTATIQITSVFNLKFISYQTIRDILNHPKQNNQYQIITSKLLLMIVILKTTGASSLFPVTQLISFIGLRDYRPSNSLNSICTIQSLWSQNIFPTAPRRMMDGMFLQKILKHINKL